MVGSGRAKVGPILGIVGSATLILSGILSFTRQAAFEIQLGPLFLSWEDLGFDPLLFIIQGIVTLACALLGVLGAIFALKGKKFGAIVLLLVGVFALIGSFVPMGTFLIGEISYPQTIVNWFIYAESILIVIGGILALVLR